MKFHRQILAAWMGFAFAFRMKWIVRPIKPIGTIRKSKEHPIAARTGLDVSDVMVADVDLNAGPKLWVQPLLSDLSKDFTRWE